MTSVADFAIPPLRSAAVRTHTIPTRTVRLRSPRRLAVALVLISLLVPLYAAVAAEKDVPVAAVHRVEQGDTLWEIARRHAPAGMDLRVAIEKIRRFNHLPNSMLQPGIELRIPRLQ